MARASRTPFVVLGILGILEDKPLSGYDIKHIIDNTISHFWAESYGQIYPVLKRLAAEGMIRARAIKESGRKKIVYAITPLGEKRLGAWLAEPPEEGPRREELVLKLLFGSKTKASVLIRHLQARRNKAKAMLDQLAGCLKLVEGQNESYTPFQAMTIRGGIAMCKALVQWADESLATLKHLKGAK
jgi:DNA-binding PadR family transcriptional regulator